MKIIYLSKNMSDYKAAMYQNDMMEEFRKHAEVIFYGPGFKNFDPKEKIKITINKFGDADLLIVGHAWLLDKPGSTVDPYPDLCLQDCPIPKVIILNKEYTNLNEKLNWIKKNNFLCGFSHHHNIDFYEKKSNVSFKFIPFAFNENLFAKTNEKIKDIDFSFCGLLKNDYHNSEYTDARILTMKRLFHCIDDIPVLKKAKYKNYTFFWNAIPRKVFVRKIATLTKKYYRLSNRDYASLQMRSRAFLNTLSPLGLVGPRFFENIASKTLVFCEESNNVKNIFPSECFISFKSDFSDFDEKFEMAISDSVERSKIIESAFDLAFTQHTWKFRVNNMIKTINEKIN